MSSFGKNAFLVKIKNGEWYSFVKSNFKVSFFFSKRAKMTSWYKPFHFYKVDVAFSQKWVLIFNVLGIKLKLIVIEPHILAFLSIFWRGIEWKCFRVWILWFRGVKVKVQGQIWPKSCINRNKTLGIQYTVIIFGIPKYFLKRNRMKMVAGLNFMI